MTVSLGWAIYIGFVLVNSKRLPLEVSAAYGEVAPHASTWFFGYLTSGLETTTFGRYKTRAQDTVDARSRIGCWVDWNLAADYPWWADIRIKGYAVVAGRIKQESVPTFGHLGQFKRNFTVTRCVIPPLPVTVVYWLVSVMICNAIGLLLRFRK